MNQCWTPILSAISYASSSTNSSDSALPEIFLCPLINNGLISLNGEQSLSYLQGQLTCDMEKLDDNHYLNAAHCDAKGKMWAILKTFTLDDHFLLSGHQAEITASQAQLNKYGVFAKTTINDASGQWLTLGFGGTAATDWLQSQWQIEFTEDISAIDIPQGKVLKVADDRYLIILAAAEVPALLAEHQAHIYASDLWSIEEIKSGHPHLSQGTIEQYVPQMLNLHCLEAISFDKGCYAGQEMIARMKYLGKNKRAAYILQGNAGSLPNPADDLQLAVGENWRRSGTIINVAGTAEGLHILAVLPKDLAADAKLRIKDDDNSVLTVSPLPYLLEPQDNK